MAWAVEVVHAGLNLCQFVVCHSRAVAKTRRNCRLNPAGVGWCRRFPFSSLMGKLLRFPKSQIQETAESERTLALTCTFM